MNKWKQSVARVLAALTLVAVCDARSQEDGEPLHVVTTLNVLADLARAVGGEYVTVEALSRPTQDPHFVEPTPVLMRRVREADMFVEVGLQLELWADKVVAGSGNTRLQLGQPGRAIASTGIATIQLPRVLSREWGDVHPYGNPHLWLDPLNAKVMAANVAAALSRLDPAHTAAFEANLAAFQASIDEHMFGAALVERIGAKKLDRLTRSQRLGEYLEQRELTDLLGGWMAQARPLIGRSIVTYHRTFGYFAARFGFVIPIEIEERPGIPPSARHRDRVLEVMRELGVRTILEATFYDRSAGDYLAEKTGARVVVTPIDVGEAGAGVGGAHYIDLMDALVAALVASETRSGD